MPERIATCALSILTNHQVNTKDCEFKKKTTQNSIKPTDAGRVISSHSRFKSDLICNACSFDIIDSYASYVLVIGSTKDFVQHLTQCPRRATMFLDFVFSFFIPSEIGSANDDPKRKLLI
ncbi:hypothetical protein EGW08_000231 [Elysia chlorotica]|uniref:Uncharacterized protein n=1 Tax=Elysia chlorotica TaxID=188477 RepID=A0A3S1BN31_ELYCH|nr:hypothetical protein EGW08_000231 [Elysia chlorotica]